MGEPATPTQEQRAARLELAKEVVNAVREDVEGPLALPDFEAASSRKGAMKELHAWAIRIDETAFGFAQDLVDTRTALDEALAIAAKYAPADSADAARLSQLRVLDLAPPEPVAPDAAATA